MTENPYFVNPFVAEPSAAAAVNRELIISVIIFILVMGLIIFIIYLALYNNSPNKLASNAIKNASGTNPQNTALLLKECKKTCDLKGGDENKGGNEKCFGIKIDDRDNCTPLISNKAPDFLHAEYHHNIERKLYKTYPERNMLLKNDNHEDFIFLGKHESSLNYKYVTHGVRIKKNMIHTIDFAPKSIKGQYERIIFSTVPFTIDVYPYLYSKTSYSFDNSSSEQTNPVGLTNLTLPWDQPQKLWLLCL